MRRVPAIGPPQTREPLGRSSWRVATSQPLASAAGLRALQEGGNAIDAAVTAAAVLAVVEPMMNGVGGDLFAIVHDARTKKLTALNASGRSAYAASPEAFALRGLKDVPRAGILSVSVPGVVDASIQWGGFQGILIDPKTGVLMGGPDPRRDGLAIGF